MRLARVACGALAGVLAACAHASWAIARDIDFARGDTLDPAVWTLEQGFQRNRESQYYMPANVAVRRGVLVIEARREEVPNAAYRAGSADWRRSAPRAAYTSGSIVLKEPLQYGRIEVVARSPSGAGVWPAIWLLHEGGGQYGEIDLYEAVGKHPDTVFGAVHYGATASTREHRGGSIVVPGFDGSWRTHSLEWTPEHILMSVDKLPVFSFAPRDAVRGASDPLRRPMFLHINLALGGNWGGAIAESALPARFEIASIRIYRWVDDGGDARAVAPALGDPAVRWGR